MKSRFIALLAAVFLFVHTAAAMASDINDAGAAMLKKEIADALDWRLKIMQTEGEGLFTEGEVKVAPKDSYYAVTLPRLYIKSKKGESLDIGVINANAVPGKNADEWILSAALPTPLTLLDAQSQPVLTLAIGKQRFSGVWRPKDDLFSAIDAAYEDIRLETPKKDIEAMIGSIHTTLDLNQEADGSWSGPNSFDLKNLAVKLSAAQSIALSLESVVSKANYGRIDISGSQKLRHKIQEMAQTATPPTADDIKAVIRDNSDYFKGFADSVSNSMTLTKLDITGQDSGGTPFTAHLGDLSFIFDVTGLQKEKARAAFNSSMNDLKISVLSGDFADIMPQSFAIDLSVDNVPVQKIIEAVTQAATSGSSAAGTTPDPVQVQKDVAGLAMLPVTLSNAGARIDIKNTSITSPALTTRLSGMARADATAISKATADFTLIFNGLDALIDKMSEPSASGTPDDAGKKNMLMMLTPLQMMGQQETAANGATSRSYHFELLPDGKMMMNGADMTAVKSMIESQIKPPAPVPGAGGDVIPLPTAPAAPETPIPH